MDLNLINEVIKMNKFEVGKKYGCRSICDSNCIFWMTVLSRTEKTIKAQVNAFGLKTLRINISDDNNESVKPVGSFSMSPTIYAKQVMQ